MPETPTDVLVTGGRLVDRTGSRQADLVVDGARGVIADVVEPGSASGADRLVLDAAGCVVCPGLVDLNAHVGDRARPGAETVEAATRAAALGGYTAIVAVGSEQEPLDGPDAVADLARRARAGHWCEVMPSGALTTAAGGRSLAPMGELLDAGVRLFTDGDRPVGDPGVLLRALEYLRGVADGAGEAATAACRPELEALVDGGVMHEGPWSSRLGVPGRPALAELLAVQRDLALAGTVGVPLHIQQVSTAAALDAVRAAKAAGQAVTAEVSPHHLTLDHSACAAFDPRTKLLPPLRTAEDVAALRAGILDGTIDAIATAHRPCTADDTERPFDDAPWGAVGLETTVAILLTSLDVDVEVLVPLLSWKPAAIAGLGDRHGTPLAAGRPANLTVIDPEHTWTVHAGSMASRGANTPFDGRELTGAVRHTLWEGRPTVIDRRAIAPGSAPAPIGAVPTGSTP